MTFRQGFQITGSHPQEAHPHLGPPLKTKGHIVPLLFIMDMFRGILEEMTEYKEPLIHIKGCVFIE